MRRLLEVILKKAGYEVISTEDGLQAMKHALENTIDAVVADAIMPGLTGYDLCRMLKNKSRKKRCSGHNFKRTRTRVNRNPPNAPPTHFSRKHRHSKMT